MGLHYSFMDGARRRRSLQLPNDTQHPGLEIAEHFRQSLRREANGLVNRLFPNWVPRFSVLLHGSRVRSHSPTANYADADAPGNGLVDLAIRLPNQMTTTGKAAIGSEHYVYAWNDPRVPPRSVECDGAAAVSDRGLVAWRY